MLGNMLRASGEFSLNQTDFGIKLVSVAGGALKLKDELKIFIRDCGSENGVSSVLFSDAEGGEDEAEDVVGGGGAGEGVEGAEGGVEIEQKHLVRDAVGDGGLCRGEGCAGIAGQPGAGGGW